MTDNPKIPADSEAIARCREALETDDMLSVAQRRDWACLMENYDAASIILEAAREVARIARKTPEGWTDDGNPDTMWIGTFSMEQALEKLVLAVEAKHGRAAS